MLAGRGGVRALRALRRPARNEVLMASRGHALGELGCLIGANGERGHGGRVTGVLGELNGLNHLNDLHGACCVVRVAGQGELVARDISPSLLPGEG